MINIWKIRIFLWLILAGIIIWLAWMKIVPSGAIVYSNDFSGDYNEFIQKIGPVDRVEPISAGTQKIIGDPVYFTLQVPRYFEKALMKIKYKNNSELPIIEAGVLTDKVLWQYDLEPIENKIIDQLSMIWHAEREGSSLLLQDNSSTSTRIYSSIDGFISDLPSRDEFALYNYKLDKEFIIPDYSSSTERNTIDYSLRGAYSFYTYIKDEDLNIEFEIQDINKNKDKDPVIVNIYFKNKIIDTKNIEDDGIFGEDNKESEPRKEKIYLSNLPEGVYKVELKANDDIITKGIETTQNKISFVNKIWVWKGNVTEIYTDVNEFNAQTANPASLQNVRIGENSLDVKETYKLFSVQLEAGIKKIEISKNDLIISGNGVFSFSEEQLFNPSYKRLDKNTDINKEDIKYILANYESPSEAGEWKEKAVEIDLANAFEENNKHNVLISIPGLRSDDVADDYIEIDEIMVELHGKSLWQKIREVISSK